MERSEIIQKSILATCFIAIALLSVKLSINHGLAVGTLIYLIPIILFCFFQCIKSPLVTFFVLYGATFSILGIARYIELPIAPGLIIDILILLNFLVLLFQYIWSKEKLAPIYFNPVLILSIVWMVYCLLEVINPKSTISNWSTTVRNIGVHIVLFQLLVFLVLNTVSKLRIFFVVWGLLIILAILKAFGQQYFGFDEAEIAWLNEGSGKTHLLHSGIRYFSFYTDAANFGCNMGLTIVLFLILAVNEKSYSRRFFYIIVILLAIYGFMISGTRAAVAVPLVGFVAWIVLMKEWKWIIGGFGSLAILLSLILFTNIGDNNPSIRRMRTAFQFSEDASFNVRLENQAKMKTFMSSHPFGIGMGSAKNAKGGDLMYGIATDSSLVFIWVETGIVGLVFYLLIFFTVLGYGTYYVWFVLKDRVVKNITIASVSGMSGMLVAGYANEVLHQFPTGQTIYILMGVIMISPYLDKEINNAKQIA